MAVHSMERTIAYELIIELLAHQFAFPVQWIETQDTILRDARRLVELGPAKTLLGMAQKTLEQMSTQGVQLLASTQDLQQLCYEYDEPAEDSTVDETIVQTPQSSPVPELVAEREQVTVHTVSDAPLTAISIVTALVARKLRRSASEIDVSRSIKELCGGKSTLQNELIGELGNEFRSLPDRAEDVSLSDLDAALGEVSLGPTSGAFLQRLFTAKMPARITIPAVRARLESVWGLPTHRQTAVLVTALAAEPQSRLPSLEAANQYWDGLVDGYGQSVGLPLHRENPQTSTEARKSREDEQADAIADGVGAKALARKQYETLRQYLGLPHASANRQDTVTAEVQRKLDSWTAEFSEDFLSRISPCFDVRKSR